MKTTSLNSKNLQLAFDVGHSSIGWAVLKSGSSAARANPEILGCGAVVFGADDCLASKRRAFRRQRRHTRSTRQRIARMEKLLGHLGVMTHEQLVAKHQQPQKIDPKNTGGHPAPWLLAARVLASQVPGHLCKTWPELWDVVRWYAHNRGYDGNARWSSVAHSALSAAELEELKADTEKEKHAVDLMDKYKTKTMAETVFADLFDEFGVRDPLSAPERLPFLKKYFKGNQCAFPRHIVTAEVQRILAAHRGALPCCDDRLIRLLLATSLSEEDRAFLDGIGILLPQRYEGGLLFGQLVPRFDNRMIGECPITGAHVPARNTAEFLDFRWVMTLANIRIGFGDETYGEDHARLRPLDPAERRKIDARVRALGFLKVDPDKVNPTSGVMKLGRNELREIVIKEIGCDRHNLDTLLLHPDAHESLRHVPIRGSTVAFRTAWRAFDPPADRDITRNGTKRREYLDDPLRQRFLIQLLRGKSLTPAAMIAQLEKIGSGRGAIIAERIRLSVTEECSDKHGKLNAGKLHELMTAEFRAEKLKGRARFSREKLREAFQQVFDPTKPLHPLEKGGCLEQTDEVKRRALEKPLSHQTNNHLVRHRLLILAGNQHMRNAGKRKEGLLDHIIREFAGGDKSRIARITIELARDLQQMSGMTNKEKAKELTIQLKNHHDISATLADKLSEQRNERGEPFVITATLIRKARVADDLGWECPYTGRTFEPGDLVHRRYDRDHIIPRSQRLSDALEAMVITSREINAIKDNRTALQFIRAMNEPENGSTKARLGIRTEGQFRDFVDNLKTKGGHSTDVRRRDLRKKFLLLEKYEEKQFTPGDLTKTSHIGKLGAQQLEAAFLDLPEAERPPVIAITGAVTKTFRDRSWKLLPLLGAANEQVTKALNEGEQRRLAGGDFNPKETIRNITHSHHALDAIALALVTTRIVPPGHRSLNGDLARFIVKGKLSDGERAEFEKLIAQVRLPRFYQWRPQNELFVLDLDEQIKEQIRARLAEKRVVQHIPADMSGLKVEENTRGIVRRDHGRVFLHQRTRDEKTRKLKLKETDEAAGKLIGINPPSGHSRLRQQRGVRVISDNFGVAILDHATDQKERFVIIPWHKVWHRLGGLREKNGGKKPRVLRIGSLVEVPNKSGRSDYRGLWMIRGAQFNQKQGFLVDLSAPDVIEYRVPGRKDCKQNVQLETLVTGGLKVIATRLTGKPSHATPTEAENASSITAVA